MVGSVGAPWIYWGMLERAWMDHRALSEPSEVTTNPGQCREATQSEQHKASSPPHPQKTLLPRGAISLVTPQRSHMLRTQVARGNKGNGDWGDTQCFSRSPRSYVSKRSVTPSPSSAQR